MLYAEMKSAVQDLISMCDGLESAGMVDSDWGLDQSFSNTVHSEMLLFSLFITTENGIVNENEANALNEIFDYSISPRQYEELYANIAIEPKPEQMLSCMIFIRVAKRLKALVGDSINVIDLLVPLYDELGKLLIELDESKSAKVKLAKFINDMRTHMVKETQDF